MRAETTTTNHDRMVIFLSSRDSWMGSYCNFDGNTVDSGRDLQCIEQDTQAVRLHIAMSNIHGHQKLSTSQPYTKL
eukprot:352249-Chlamydomonas_euryale.AAC.16